MAKSEWVEIQLKNGNKVFGFMGDKSSTSNTSQRDIYINEVYNLNEKDELYKAENTDGIWINGDEIISIEFFKNSGDGNNEK